VKKILTCPECGQKNISKLKICNRCGAALRPVESRWTQQEDIKNTENKEQRPQDADFSNLMNCPDCKREISRNAPNCPGCGAPIAAGIPTTKKGDLVPVKRKTSLFTWFMTGLLALAFFFAIYSGDGTRKPPPREIHSRGGLTDSQICSASIATIMGRDPTTMLAEKGPDGATHISYRRPSDAQHYSYKCKIYKNTIMWGAIDGRWRTHPDDSVVTYNVVGNEIKITDSYRDGSATKKSYSIESLAK
jgi:hypothetical protein